jgi:putative FmdB family regulatory protein
MAIYEYECTKCHHEFEAFQKKPTNKDESCPKCKSVSKKIVSQSTFRLGEKGSVSWADKGYSNK